MEFAVYVAVGLVLAAVILCFLILQKVGRPSVIPVELSTRIALLEQIAAALPATFREEARTGRDELRSAFAGHTEALDGRFAAVETRLREAGKAQTDQLTAMRTEAAEGRTELRTAFGSQTEALEKRFAAVESRLSDFGKTQTDR
jgi:DNA recombination protein RmuC